MENVTWRNEFVSDSESKLVGEFSIPVDQIPLMLSDSPDIISKLKTLIDLTSAKQLNKVFGIQGKTKPQSSSITKIENLGMLQSTSKISSECTKERILKNELEPNYDRYNLFRIMNYLTPQMLRMVSKRGNDKLTHCG